MNEEHEYGLSQQQNKNQSTKSKGQFKGIEYWIRKEIPAFFVNGEMVQGKATYDNISKSINEALKKVKKKASAKAKA